MLNSLLLHDLLDQAARVGKPIQIYGEHCNPAPSLFERLGCTMLADDGVHLLMEWSPGPR